MRWVDVFPFPDCIYSPILSMKLYTHINQSYSVPPGLKGAYCGNGVMHRGEPKTKALGKNLIFVESIESLVIKK